MGNFNLEKLNVKNIKNKVYDVINKKIKKLHKEKEALELLKKNIIEVNGEFTLRIEPLQHKIHEVDEEKLLLLDKFRNRKSVGKLYKELAVDRMKEMISHFADFGFLTPAISKLEQEFRQEDLNFTKEEEEEARETFDSMMNEMFEETGVFPDISFEDFKDMSMEDIMEKIQKQLLEDHIHSEKQEKQEAHLTKQSYNDTAFKKIYKELAKILHPDKKTDDNSIGNKEQLMKELSLAWEDRNYLKILEINILINPNAEEIQLDKKHLKEIERHITNELEEIKGFKYAVKHNVTEEFYRFNEFYSAAKSKREANFKKIEKKMQTDLSEKTEFNKNCFKSIKHTKVYLEETSYNELDFINSMSDDFMTNFINGI